MFWRSILRTEWMMTWNDSYPTRDIHEQVFQWQTSGADLSFPDCPLRDGHTIATTSRRPLTTTIFGVVAGGCRRSANVCRWSVTGCQRITSTTSRRPPTTTLFPGGFRWSANGCWWSPSSFGRPEVFDAASTTLDNQTRLPYKMNIHLILKNRWWRNRGRVVLSWSATDRRLVVGADLHNQLYHPHFKRNSNMYSWNCPRMVVKM